MKKTLLVLKNIVIACTVTGMAYLIKEKAKDLNKEKELERRYKKYYVLENKWLYDEKLNKVHEKWFKDNQIGKVAIYGLGAMGELLIQEVDKIEGVELSYIVDKNQKLQNIGYNDLKVIGIEEMPSMEKVDAVIVTPVYDFDDIKKELEQIAGNTCIVSLEDIIFNE